MTYRESAAPSLDDLRRENEQLKQENSRLQEKFDGRRKEQRSVQRAALLNFLEEAWPFALIAAGIIGMIAGMNACDKREEAENNIGKTRIFKAAEAWQSRVGASGSGDILCNFGSHRGGFEGMNISCSVRSDTRPAITIICNHDHNKCYRE